MGKYNLTIDATNKCVKIDYLKDDNTTVSGSDYFTFTRLRDEVDGWWFDRFFDAEFNQKFLFADIVKLNGSAIGVTTQAQVTALLKATIDSNSALSPNYLVYLALLTQSGTNAPVATILDNTLGDIDWTYEDVGNYRGSLANAFTNNKTTISSGIINANDGTVYNGERTNNSYINIFTSVLGGALADGKLDGTLVEIRVYL